MKILKKILLAILVVFVVSSIGAYFYFNKKFTPQENYLKVKGISEHIPLNWVSNESNKYVAILLPVQLEGISQVFYMQLDFGSPITVFYSKTLNSIQSKFSGKVDVDNKSQIISLKFALGNMVISSNKFKILNHGEKLDLEQGAVNVIGTIGTDLLEKRLIILNFKDNYCSFNNNESVVGFTGFKFEKRRILFPVKIGNKNLKLLYDSGTSGYQLIIGHNEWEKYRLKNEKTKIEKGNSWGNTLTIISAPAKEKMEIGNAVLNLSEVTYIEGTSGLQNLLMKFSGMQGMIGNKLFLNRTLTIDCKNEKYKVD